MSRICEVRISSLCVGEVDYEAVCIALVHPHLRADVGPDMNRQESRHTRLHIGDLLKEAGRPTPSSTTKCTHDEADLDQKKIRITDHSGRTIAKVRARHLYDPRA
jgi:hypothetical protein